MTESVPDTFTLPEIQAALGSSAAWSSGWAIFNRKAQMLAGWRTDAKRAIPEKGEVAMAASGFNTVLPGPTMLLAVAKEHAKNLLGVEIPQAMCSPDFRPCEYNVADIKAPLKLKLHGDEREYPLDIKRIAFSGIALVDDAVADSFTLQEHPKIKSIGWVSEERMRELEAGGHLSFPHQMAHVYRMYAVVRALLARNLPASALRLDWVIDVGGEQIAI